MRRFPPRRAWLALAVGLVVGGLAPRAQAQYPYGYGYGYGPGYNVPVTPGFGATYGGSTFGSYGFGRNRPYTTFGPVIGTATKTTAEEAAIASRVSTPSRVGNRVQRGAVLLAPPRLGIGPDQLHAIRPRATTSGARSIR